MASIRPMHIHIKHSTTEAFFQRGRKIARLADSGGKLKARRMVSFEDPKAVVAIVAPRRLALFSSVSDRAGTIAEVAARLGRSAHAVSRDVAFFVKLRIFTIESSRNGPQGIYREVRSATNKLILTRVIGRSTVGNRGD